MGAQTSVADFVKIQTAQPRNLLVVENYSDSVVIRAARNNFDSKRKSFLIRYLAAEGYIPECYQRYVHGLEQSRLKVRWVIDESLLGTFQRTGHRHIVRQIMRVILCIGLLWLALIGFAYLRTIG